LITCGKVIAEPSESFNVISKLGCECSMGKLIDEGDFEVDETKVHHRFHRDGRLAGGGYDYYLECDYGGHIVEHDSGHGLPLQLVSQKWK
jgi:hypothetical protein